MFKEENYIDVVLDLKKPNGEHITNRLPFETKKVTKKKMKIIQNEKLDIKEKIIALCKLCRKSKCVIDCVTERGVLRFRDSLAGVSIYYSSNMGEEEFPQHCFVNLNCGIDYATSGIGKIKPEKTDVLNALIKFYEGDKFDINAEHPDYSIERMMCEMTDHSKEESEALIKTKLKSFSEVKEKEPDCETTGNPILDDILRSKGITDFSSYREDPEEEIDDDIFIWGGK